MEEDFNAVAGGDGVSVHAGFPNPAAEYRQQGKRLALDLNQLLVRHPSSTYLFRIRGHSWEAYGIFDGDIAVIDRALNARVNDLVVNWEGDEFYICRFAPLPKRTEAWGVVSAIIHQYRAESQS